DQTALNELMALSCPYLLATAKAEIGAALRVRVTAADLVQNTLMEACRDYPYFQGRTEADLLGWVRQILVHNLANEIRRHIRTAKRSLSREVPWTEAVSTVLQHMVRSEGESPSAHAQSRERGEA